MASNSKAIVLKATHPTTSEGVEHYLAGGFVKGVGPVLAKKLVGHFGAEVLNVIASNPVDLESVDGIGPKRRERIAGAWQEGMQIHEIMVFLHSHGVSTGRAVRIYKTYGNLAIQTVWENPYTLAMEIHGIGFATADQIAQSVGIPKDSQNRARAGIDHVLLGATSEGHCTLPLEKLKAAAVKLLEVAVETVEQAVSQMLPGGFLLLEETDGEPLVFLPPLEGGRRYCDQDQAAGLCRGEIPQDGIRKSRRLVRDEDWKDSGPEPARGVEDCSHQSSRNHHRRSRRGQDDVGELDPVDPSRQEGELPALRTHWEGGEATHGDHWAGSEDNSPSPGN